MKTNLRPTWIHRTLSACFLCVLIALGAEPTARAQEVPDSACGTKAPGGFCADGSYCTSGPDGFCRVPQDPVSQKYCGSASALAGAGVVKDPGPTADPLDGFCKDESWCTSGPKGVCYAPSEPISLERCGYGGFCQGESWCSSGPEGVCYAPDQPISIEHCSPKADCGFCVGESWCTCGPDGVCYAPDQPISIAHCGPKADCGFCVGDSWCTCGPNGVCYAPDQPISIEHCGHTADCGFCDGDSWCTCGPDGVCYAPDQPISIEHCGNHCDHGSLCTGTLCYAPTAPESIAVCACQLVPEECSTQGFCDGGAFCSTSCGVCYATDNPLSEVLCGGASIDQCCNVETISPSTLLTGSARIITISGYALDPSATLSFDADGGGGWVTLSTPPVFSSTTPLNALAADLLYPWSATINLSAFWPAGGVVRIHVSSSGASGMAAAFPDNACVVSHQLDAWSSVLDSCTTFASLTDQLAWPVLTLVDTSVDPVAFPWVVSTPQNYLTRKATTLADAPNYYSHIDAGPFGSRRTLPGWKCANGFYDPTLCPWYAGAAETVAYYANEGDLGFGREMHCREVKGCDGTDSCSLPLGSPQCNFVVRTACYVTNYGNANAAVAHSSPLATVTMESVTTLITPAFCSSFLGVSPVDQVRFYVFEAPSIDPTETVLPEVALDTEGKKPAPGLCLSCHGGKYDPSTERVTGASFLPFDTCSFGYADTPAGYGLEDQYEAFRQLNAMVLDTNPSSGIQDLIDGWYAPSGVHTVGAVANSGYVPADWVANGQQEVYLQVVKPYCRTCHTAQSPSPSGRDFVTYTATGTSHDFAISPALIQGDVCNAPRGMPHAERTHRRLWSGPGRGYLVDWFASQGVTTQCN